MGEIPGRETFFGVELVWLFYVLALVAAVSFFTGLFARLKAWRAGMPTAGAWSWRGLLKDGLLMARLWRVDKAAGLLHSALLWSFLLLFLGTVLWGLHEYTYPYLKGSPYLVFSFVLDMAGLFYLAGVVGLGLRRLILGRGRLPGGLEDWAALALLLAVGVTGYLYEAARLQATWPAWAWASPVGAWLARPFIGLIAAPVINALWWAHALCALGLIAWLPWMKLFHALATPLNLATAEGRAEPSAEMAEEAEQPYTLLQLISTDACARCNRCELKCPSFAAGEGLSPRDFVRQVRLQVRATYPLTAKAGDHEQAGLITTDPFLCTTCGACQEVCPAGVRPLELLRGRRSALVEEGQAVPGDVIEALESLSKYANPWSSPKKKRGAWAKGLDLADLSQGDEADWLLFAGCTTSIDQRAQSMAQAMASLMTQAKLSTGVLGRKEPCCGDIARRLGELGLFEMLMEDTVGEVNSAEAGGMVVMSPHCAYTMNVDYPALAPGMGLEEGWERRPLHYSQLLDQMIGDGSLAVAGRLSGTVTFHDPCYLGRHRGIFDAPRRVLTALGLDIAEMENHHADSLCCGAGGGRMWYAEVEGADTHISALRVAQAAATGASRLVTACPLCLIMLTDAVKTAGLEDRLQVVDLAELAAEACLPAAL